MGGAFSQHGLHIIVIVCGRRASVSSSAWRHSRGGVETRVIYGSPFPAEPIVWKISRLHKNCLKNEICDYILFISGLRQHGTCERATQRRGSMVQQFNMPRPQQLFTAFLITHHIHFTNKLLITFSQKLKTGKWESEFVNSARQTEGNAMD